ncbi:GTP-binding protein [Alicyclobacillus contaminans]|uniref:ribosome biogenesis GTPase YqeH n=1 Tax=Alicyclobacillus contaminans TaxID=392016 RepID=UPI0004265EF3|nr:ribosome biogenesis GTPase YqeH [Alicyclobacillus contaminans]GMA52117.1 GTP-binding protein [Alicyclobacillus contaminans]
MSERELSTESERHCAGCGIVLQSDFPDAPGYAPASALARSQPVCRRCFRIRHYGEFSRIVIPYDQYRREVSAIAAHPGLVLYVVDVFDLPGSVIPDLAGLIGGSRVIAVVNKVDLLPREVRVEALASWIRRELRKSGVELADVVFVSGSTGFGMDRLLANVEAAREDIVYAVGMANVGKSTILNGLMRRLQQDAQFTASRVPGTTIGMVSTRLTTEHGRVKVVSDTPGLLNGDRVIDKLCGDCLKQTIPQDPLRQRVYQLDPGQTLWLGGFARFDFLSGPHQPVVVHVSNRLVVHRTKVERAEAIYAEHSDDILKVPCPECRRSLGKLVPWTLRAVRQKPLHGETDRAIEIPAAGCDVVLSGLGWISLQGHNIRAVLYAPPGVRVSQRPRLLGQLSRAGRT